MASEYRPGSWTALVTDRSVAVLPPEIGSGAVVELWRIADAGGRLGAWVEFLATRGISALPSFAMAELHDDGVRLLVRGPLEVRLADRIVSGSGYTTWREEIVTGDVTSVAITAQETDDAPLPITGGVVKVAELTVDLVASGAAGEDEYDEDEIAQTVAQLPGLSAVLRGDPAVPGEPGTGQMATERVSTEQVSTGQVAMELVPDQVATGQPSGGRAAAELPAADEQVPAAPPPAAAQEDEDDEYDHLLWPTEQAQAAERRRRDRRSIEDADSATPEPAGPAETGFGTEAPRQAVEETSHEAFGVSVDGPSGDAMSTSELEATRAPDPDRDDWAPPASTHREELPAPGGGAGAWSPAPAPEQERNSDGDRAPEPRGIIDSVPGRSAPPLPTAPSTGARGPAPAALRAPSSVTEPEDHTVLAGDLRLPSTGSTSRVEEPEPPARDLFELLLTSGQRIVVDRPVLLGRAPEASRFSGETVPRLVSVSSPERDVSASHIEILPAHGHVVATDLHSTNGTVVTAPGQTSVRLQPGVGMPLTAGTVIELGTGVTVTVLGQDQDPPAPERR